MQPKPPDISDLVNRLAQGERRAVAEALTRLERQTADAAELLAELAPHLGQALVVGVTGPPGAGKSTLVNQLIREARATGRRVAVLAVDPSSPVTGGAILGDRIRMTQAYDDGALVRSLGSRGALGGLTPAAVRMIDVLDAAGFGLVLLETVGTGQSETDVAEIADLVVVVSAPGLGDGIQAMKAGLLEIADILVVNKGDREGAQRTAEELGAGLSLRADGADIPIITTAAIDGTGIDALWQAILAKGANRLSESLDDRRRRRARYLIARAAAEMVAKRIRDGGAAIDALADELLAGRTTALAAAALLAGGKPM